MSIKQSNFNEMKEELIVTKMSRLIADEIKTQMEVQGITATKLERMLEDKCNKYTIRRIRKGSSGCILRSYEQVLGALGLRIGIIHDSHKDIID